jgi:hypothetical protein
LHILFPWSNDNVVEASHVLHKKTAYLNVPFFLLRAVLFFLFWSAIAFLLSKWSRLQDSTADATLTRRIRMVAGPSLVVFVLTATFAGVDWMMSLEPEWFSTIYGMHFVVGAALTTLAFCIVMVAFLADQKPFAGVLTTRHYHHLGNMLFAFTILWAYMSFSQYIIIWSGNQVEIHRRIFACRAFLCAVLSSSVEKDKESDSQPGTYCSVDSDHEIFGPLLVDHACFQRSSVPDTLAECRCTGRARRHLACDVFPADEGVFASSAA